MIKNRKGVSRGCGLDFISSIKEVFGYISDEVKAEFAFCLKKNENNV